jgi:hypothetical protein
MTGFIWGGKQSRYYVGGAAGHFLSAAALAGRGLQEFSEINSRRIERAQKLLVLREQGEELDEVDQEFLAKIILELEEKEAKLTAQATARLETRAAVELAKRDAKRNIEIEDANKGLLAVSSG